MIDQERIWDFMDSLSQESLTKFIKKLIQYYNIKFETIQPNLNDTTLDYQNYQTNNRMNKIGYNDISQIKKDLEEVKSYISRMKGNNESTHGFEKEY